MRTIQSTALSLWTTRLLARRYGREYLAQGQPLSFSLQFFLSSIIFRSLRLVMLPVRPHMQVLPLAWATTVKKYFEKWFLCYERRERESTTSFYSIIRFLVFVYLKSSCIFAQHWMMIHKYVCSLLYQYSFRKPLFLYPAFCFVYLYPLWPCTNLKWRILN